MALAPLSQALQADQTRLALYANPDDPSKPIAGKEKEYEETASRMTDTIGKMRGILRQKPGGPNAVEAGVGDLLDKLHITNHLKSHVADARKKAAEKYEAQNRSMAGSYAAGALPYEMTPEGQTESHKTADAIKVAEAKAKSNYVNFKGPNGDIVAVDVATQTPPPGYVKAGNEAVTQKPLKGLKALEQGGVAYGVEDQDSGKQYLISQLGLNGDAPPEAKQIWQTIQQAKKEKEDAADKKQRESDERQMRGLAAIAGRMATSENFQEQMAAYRSDLTTYRALDKQARDAAESAELYANDANIPGNKSAFDTALITDYTSILAKGGRKTQAEINFAQQIGGLGLRTEKMFDKAKSGELPKEMRRMYVEYLKARAGSMRKEADEAKPSSPEISAPQGPTQRKNKAAKAAGGTQPSIIIVSPEDMK